MVLFHQGVLLFCSVFLTFIGEVILCLLQREHRQTLQLLLEHKWWGFTETILQCIWAKTSSAASLDEFVGDMVNAVVIEEQTCPEGAVLDTTALCCRCPGDNPEPLLLPSSPQETLAELEGWPAGLTGEIALWWRSLPSGVPCMWFEAIFLCPGPLMAMVQYQAAGSCAYFFSWLHLHLHIGGKEAEKG